MPEEKKPVEKKQEEQETETPSTEEDSVDELAQLRSELEQHKQEKTALTTEKQLLESRLKERDGEFRREFSRQGQQLGERIKTLETTLSNIIQPDKPAKKKSRFDENLVVPDPVTDPDNFKRFQTSLLETIEDLREQNQKLASGGQNNQELKALQGKIEQLEYQHYLSQQETKLRTEYGFDDADLERVHGYMRDYTQYDPEIAAIKIPELKRKMFDSYGKRDEELDERPRTERKSKPKFDPVKAGQEMLKTASDKVPRGGAKNADEDSLNWRTELQSALNDGSFYEWPEAKRKEYELKIKQAAANEKNGTF